MTSLPHVTIGLMASLNVPTDGYRFVQHDTQPDDDIYQTTWKVAGELIFRLKEILPIVSSIDCAFNQRPIPGELWLTVTVTLEPFKDVEVSAIKQYTGISSPHMRENDMLVQFLINPLMTELRRNLARARSERIEQNDRLTGLLRKLGEPSYVGNLVEGKLI